MADKDPSVAAAEAAATQLVKSFYPDLFQPAAREVGTELHEFVRAVMVAGRGFGYLIRETYEPFVLRALAKVPVGQRIAPPSSLLGRILEGVSYEAEGSHTEKMSSSLLSAAMDSERKGDAHPAFVDVIHRMSVQEIEILTYALSRPISVIARPHSRSFINIKILPETSIGSVENLDLLFDNLNGAGLISFLRQRTIHKPFRDMEHIAEVVMNLEYGSRQEGLFEVMLSPFGRAFLAACASDA